MMVDATVDAWDRALRNSLLPPINLTLDKSLQVTVYNN